VASISIPLLLGSIWALMPALVGDRLLVICTLLEDDALKKKLKGYKKYSGKVRSRLLPGIW
jgi:protein-S-isoprenylcysteine O-methyltransferase Ste14